MLVCPFLRYNGNSAFTKGSKEMRKMSKSEWVETAVIFIALALLWVPILGLQQWWLRAALWYVFRFSFGSLGGDGKGSMKPSKAFKEKTIFFVPYRLI